LQDVLQDLGPLKAQGRVEGFFTNAENAGKLSGLVEDIRDAMMEYQVCGSSYLFAPRLMFVLDLTATGYLQQAARDTPRYKRREPPPHRESHYLSFVLMN